MTKAAEHVLEQALQLDPTDRAELIEQLFDLAAGDVEADEPCTPSTDPAYVAAWEAEIRERVASVERGDEKPIPWREAMAQIRRGVIDDE